MREGRLEALFERKQVFRGTDSMRIKSLAYYRKVAIDQTLVQKGTTLIAVKMHIELFRKVRKHLYKNALQAKKKAFFR